MATAVASILHVGPDVHHLDIRACNSCCRRARVSALQTWSTRCKTRRMDVLQEAQVVTETIAAPVRTVYEFARQLESMPRWASGLASGIERRGERWFAKSPMGEVEVSMAEANEFGVLDHVVTLPDGTSVHNAFRATPAGTGTVLTFVVLRAPETTRQAFDADAAHVRRDFRALKSLLESGEPAVD